MKHAPGQHMLQENHVTTFFKLVFNFCPNQFFRIGRFFENIACLNLDEYSDRTFMLRFDTKPYQYAFRIYNAEPPKKIMYYFIILESTGIGTRDKKNVYLVRTGTSTRRFSISWCAPLQHLVLVLKWCRCFEHQHQSSAAKHTRKNSTRKM